MIVLTRSKFYRQNSSEKERLKWRRKALSGRSGCCSYSWVLPLLLLLPSLQCVVAANKNFTFGYGSEKRVLPVLFVGDKLTIFFKPLHNVVQVPTLVAWQACNTTGSKVLARPNQSPLVFTIASNRTIYIISTTSTKDCAHLGVRAILKIQGRVSNTVQQQQRQKGGNAMQEQRGGSGQQRQQQGPVDARQQQAGRAGQQWQQSDGKGRQSQVQTGGGQQFQQQTGGGQQRQQQGAGASAPPFKWWPPLQGFEPMQEFAAAEPHIQEKSEADQMTQQQGPGLHTDQGTKNGQPWQQQHANVPQKQGMNDEIQWQQQGDGGQDWP